MSKSSAGTRRLAVWAAGRRLGRLDENRSGFLTFAYDEAWLEDPEFAVSVSLPVRPEPFGHTEITPFLAGLLPDLASVREKIGKAFDVDGGNDFSLLSAIGRDAAGALSFTPDDGTTPSFQPDDASLTRVPLSIDALAEQVAMLPNAPLVVDEDGEVRYSLAGVNNKLALVETGEPSSPFALPKYGAPSTHILKTDIARLLESSKVEHFCLHLARRAGLPAVETSLLPLPGGIQRDPTTVILIRRYDRIASLTDGNQRRLRRVHQEDFCQALGVLPSVKYEKDGGPDLAAMLAVLRSHSLRPAKDLSQFLDAVIFNVLVGNPDAHAKNYALLHRRGGVRLAPLYDVLNAAAFKRFYKSQRPRIAQAISGKRDPNSISTDDWRAFARANGLSPRALVARTRELAGVVVAAAEQLLVEHMDDPVSRSELLVPAVDDIRQRCEVLNAR